MPEEDRRFQGVAVGGQGHVLEFAQHRVERLTQSAGLLADLLQTESGLGEIGKGGTGTSKVVVMTPPNQQLLERRLEYGMQRQASSFL